MQTERERQRLNMNVLKIISKFMPPDSGVLRQCCLIKHSGKIKICKRYERERKREREKERKERKREREKERKREREKESKREREKE